MAVGLGFSFKTIRSHSSSKMNMPITRHVQACHVTPYLHHPPPKPTYPTQGRVSSDSVVMATRPLSWLIGLCTNYEVDDERQRTLSVHHSAAPWPNAPHPPRPSPQG